MHFHTSGKIAWLRDVIIKILHLHIHDVKWDLCMTRFYLDSDFDTPSFTYLQQVWKNLLCTISQNTCAWMISLLRTWFLLFLLRWEGWLVIQVSSIIITNCQIQLSGSPTNAISTDVIFYYSIFCHFMHKWEKIPKCRTFCKGLLTWFDSMYHIQL